LRGTRTDLVVWNELFRYRRGEVPKKGSAFAGWVSNRIPAEATVVDLGTGNGRDTDWFTRQGHRVISFDFSGAALRQTTRKVTRSDGEPDVRVLLLNDLRSVLLAGAELSREPQPPQLYARGLVDCLDDDARRNLWRLCSMTLRRGGSLFLQYAAARPDLPETQLEGLVTRVDTTALVREITAAGGRVVLCEESPGHDFFDHSDPHVARLEVRWDNPAPEPTGATTPNPQEEQS
jgi:SAM-dependent methyltransferase